MLGRSNWGLISTSVSPSIFGRFGLCMSDQKTAFRIVNKRISYTSLVWKSALWLGRTWIPKWLPEPYPNRAEEALISACS